MGFENEEKATNEIVEQLDEKEWKLFQKINEIIIEEKLFQYPDLSLDYVAQKVGLNRYIISKLINKATGKNFNTFVNEYRIKEAIRRLSDRQNNNYTIDAIAFDCGFSNRISFYRSFKKKVGISPSEFKEHAT
ncbi:AraC family transcriptional regulator [Bacteroidales bacterium OttesenSCG-928-M11]|nr:AraC family transcriptional regulator [Bacteroidales bacterium OttesenSCG-928-M11]